MNNRWLQLEYVGKGVCLALISLLAVETLLKAETPRGDIFFGATAAGLVLCLGWAALKKLREGYRIAGRVPAFLLFLLLENPVLIYVGLLGGMILGALLLVFLAGWTWWYLLAALAGGVALGFIFQGLRQVQNRWVRAGTILILAAGAAAGVLYWLDRNPELVQGSVQFFSLYVLLGIPCFYLLTLAGRAEETELEIGAVCLALGVGLWNLLPMNARIVAAVLPVGIYVVYTQRVLKSLQVFKYVLLGMSHNNLGRHRAALLAYRRALQIDPNNQMAQEGRWRVHKDMDFSVAVHDPATMALVDLDLCLQRAAELLLQPKPSAERMEESHKLLDLVLNQRPMMEPAIFYWRAVAHTHAREFDKAEAELRTVLDSAKYGPENAYRDSVLMAAWQLVLLQHPELNRRVGTPLLTQEGRRMEAIAAVERQLAKTPDDAGAWELKRYLYNALTEPEYRVRAGGERGVPAEEFDHEYCVQLGLAMIGDSARWQRGAEYLRMAVSGLPARGPTIYYQIAQAAQRAADDAGAKANYDLVKQSARAVGIKNLAADDQQAYFATVKQLGESAYERGDIDTAIENLMLYTESPQSGVDTLRLLSELFADKKDPLSALHINEKALLYDGSNKLLLDRKDTYYYSVEPAELKARLEQVRKSFDVAYCVKKAKSLLSLKIGGPEQVDWALHLAQLARIAQPESLAATMLCAQARLRRGEQSEAVPLLEEVRAGKPESFASSDDEEGWFAACRVLGDLYLKDLGKPDLAIQCYVDYRKHPKSGADTLYKMGQAFEQLGDRVRAAKCYQNVTVYSEHPLAPDAQMALYRLESSGKS